MRRLASKYVQAISASHTTTRKRMSRFTKRFRPSFVMPKSATSMGRGAWARGAVYFVASGANPGSASEKKPAEQVAECEKDEDHDRYHHGDEAHHLEKL